jgi:transketolase
LEQIKVDLAYSGYSVVILGVSGGFSYGALGATHHSLHDIAVLRAIPGIDVVLPSDRFQTVKLVACLLDHPRPVYVRVGRNAVPDIYTETDCAFTFDKANRLLDGCDLTIIGTGETVYACLQAANLLARKGIQARVLDMHTVKPLDEQALQEAAYETGRILTVEEHSVFGGLGSAVAEWTGQHHPVPLKLMGVPDEFVVTGTPSEIAHYYRLDAEGIYQTVLEWLKN